MESAQSSAVVGGRRRSSAVESARSSAVVGSGIGTGIGTALLVGLTDTLGRVLLPLAFATVMEPSEAAASGAALASMSIYILMAAVLVVRPTGLFGAP